MKVRTGDIIVSLTRPHHGSIALIKKEHEGCVASTGFAIIRNIDETKVLKEYLVHALRSSICLDQMLRRSSGGNYPAITEEELANIKIPVPPIDIQRRLVAELDTAHSERDRALAEAERLPSQLDARILKLLGIDIPKRNYRDTYALKLAKARGTRLDPMYHHPRYQEAIKALYESRCEIRFLGEILLDIAGGATPRAGDAQLYADSGIKFLRILNIKPNRLDFSELNFIKPEVHESLLKRSQLAAEDVLMTITGRVGTSTVAASSDLPANINQHIVRLRIDKSRCMPLYLAAYLNTSIGLLLSNRSVSGGTRIALDYSAIKAIPIAIPEFNVQQKVIEAVEQKLSEDARLSALAENVWNNARNRFEQQLLHGGIE